VKSDDNAFSITNKKALFLWGFVFFWFSFLAIFFYLYLTEEIPGQLGAWFPVILLIFLGAGIAIAKWAFVQPVVRLSINGTEVIVVSQYPFGSSRFVGTVNEVSNAIIREDTDSEGDPYFKCEIQFREKVFVVWEDHVLQDVEQKHAAINAALKTKFSARHLAVGQRVNDE
jgi:hypothetical protein